MRFLSSGFLAAGAAAALALIALHFLALARPMAWALPTARFVPEGEVRAMARSRWPTDLWLLLLRVLAVLLLAAGFAQPVRQRARVPVARLIVADVSRAAASIAGVQRAAGAELKPGDALVLFDSAARVVRGDSARVALGDLRQSGARGSLSAAIAAATRATVRGERTADSVELVIVSPLAEEELDAATRAIRATWHGRARIVRVSSGASSVMSEATLATSAADDPLGATLALAQKASGPATPVGTGAKAERGVRIVRGAVTDADSAFARAGGVLVEWPSNGAPDGWTRRASTDTIGALIAGVTAVVAPWARSAIAPRAIRADSTSRVVARWADAEPAAIERRLGTGCVRQVAVNVPSAGDLVLRPSFVSLLRALTVPCGTPRLSPVPDEALAWLRGTGPLLSTALLPPRAERSVLAPWLIGLALLLLGIEPLFRRGGTSADASIAAGVEPDDVAGASAARNARSVA